MPLLRWAPRGCLLPYGAIIFNVLDLFVQRVVDCTSGSLESLNIDFCAGFSQASMQRLFVSATQLCGLSAQHCSRGLVVAFAAIPQPDRDRLRAAGISLASFGVAVGGESSQGHGGGAGSDGNTSPAAKHTHAPLQSRMYTAEGQSLLSPSWRPRLGRPVLGAARETAPGSASPIGTGGPPTARRLGKLRVPPRGRLPGGGGEELGDLPGQRPLRRRGRSRSRSRSRSGSNDDAGSSAGVAASTGAGAGGDAGAGACGSGSMPQSNPRRHADRARFAARLPVLSSSPA